MPVPLDSPGDRLLEALGWQVRWESWVLVLPENREVATQAMPAGHEIRTATSGADHRAAWIVVEDAFLEWSVRDRTTFEAFAARTVQRPGFRPWQLRLLVDPGGDAVGACFATMDSGSAWVDRIAVRRDRRGHGHARALLADAFGLARQHGARTLKLSTDSRTGALGLYLRVGMEVGSTWVNRATRTDEVRA